MGKTHIFFKISVFPKQDEPRHLLNVSPAAASKHKNLTKLNINLMLKIKINLTNLTCLKHVCPTQQHLYILLKVSAHASY